MVIDELTFRYAYTLYIFFTSDTVHCPINTNIHTDFCYLSDMNVHHKSHDSLWIQQIRCHCSKVSVVLPRSRVAKFMVQFLRYPGIRLINMSLKKKRRNQDYEKGGGKGGKVKSGLTL